MGCRVNLENDDKTQIRHIKCFFPWDPGRGREATHWSTYPGRQSESSGARSPPPLLPPLLLGLAIPLAVCFAPVSSFLWLTSALTSLYLILVAARLSF